MDSGRGLVRFELTQEGLAKAENSEEMDLLEAGLENRPHFERSQPFSLCPGVSLPSWLLA